MNGILLGLGIILNYFLCAILLEHIDAIKCTVLTVFLYFCYYVTLSGMLFIMDIFSIEKTVVLIVIAEGIVLFAVRKKKMEKLSWPVRTYLFPIILVLCILPFIWNKFGFYGMGQDEGVYQTQAIAFINHSYENQKDFQEYELLDEQGKEYLKHFMHSRLVGLYWKEDILSDLTIKAVGDVPGVYHGIPTFSALLALWGEIFGMKHMAGIQTIFYICGLFLLFFTCENMGLKNPVKYVVGVLYACSPILIWISKSSLTEMFLVCIVIGFLYFLTSVGNNVEIGCAALAIVTFSFYHLTIYTMLPIFILLFWGMFLYNRKNGYIYASITVLFFFMGAMIGFLRIATTYCRGNLRPLCEIIPFINSPLETLPFLIGISILGIILGFLMLAFREKLMIALDKTKRLWHISVRIGIVLFIIIQIHIIRQFMEDGDGVLLQALQNSSIFGFIIYSGGVLLILSVAYVFYRPSICWKSAKSMVIAGMFGWCVMFYVSFMRKDIRYHYYYGRYLAPYICIVLLLIGIVINEWNTIAGKAIVWITVIGYMIVCMPYNLVLARNNDDTRMSWDVMEDIAAIIPDNVVVYMDEEVGTVLYLPVRELTGVPVFPIKNYELQEKIIDRDDENIDIYYISGMNQYHPMCDMVYGNWYETSRDVDKNRKNIIPLPQEMRKEENNIAVYKVLKEQYQYQLADRDIKMSGFYSLEKNNFRWSLPERNVIRCILHKDNYIVSVAQGTSIPLDALGREELEVRLEINGEYVDSYTITKDKLNADLVFELPAEMVEEGFNDVSFICEPWSPQEYGLEDNRELGIAIKQILFQKASYQYQYRFGDMDDIKLSGFYPLEKNNFRWSLPEGNVIRCILHKDNYIVSATQGTVIPLDALGREELEVGLEINGKYVDSYTITKDKLNADLVFELPAEMVKEGFNDIAFICKPWSPQEFGSSDDRKLGIAINQILFQQK